MTAALEGGVSGQQHAPAALYPRERPVVYEIILKKKGTVRQAIGDRTYCGTTKSDLHYRQLTFS